MADSAAAAVIRIPVYHRSNRPDAGIKATSSNYRAISATAGTDMERQA
jgi:hypothetical protein